MSVFAAALRRVFGEEQRNGSSTVSERKMARGIAMGNKVIGKVRGSNHPRKFAPWHKVVASVAIGALVGGYFAQLPQMAEADSSATSFAKVFEGNLIGNIIAVGNTSLTCDPKRGFYSTPADPNANCASIQAGSGTGQANNDNFYMINLDQDADSSTFNSSMSVLNLPAGATVQWAGLYWGARQQPAKDPSGNALPGTNAPASVGTMKLQGPLDTQNGAGYKDVGTIITSGQQVKTWGVLGSNGQLSNNDASNAVAKQVAATYGFPYQGFADVTTYVQQQGSGAYWGANVAGATGPDANGGWSLVVVYSAFGLTMRHIEIFNGFDFIGGSPVDKKQYTSEVTFNNFQVPNENALATFVSLAYDGDRVGSLSSVGNINNADNITLWDQISSGNYFNSTNDYNGYSVPASNPNNPPEGWRNPAPQNMLGYDVKNTPVSNLRGGLPNTTLQFADSSGSSFWPGMIGMAIDIGGAYFGTSTKTVTNLNNNVPAQPGDTLLYTLFYNNTAGLPGDDQALNAISIDPIPAGTTYVPGSMQFVPYYNAQWGTKGLTDNPSDNDGAYFDANCSTAAAKQFSGHAQGCVVVNLSDDANTMPPATPGPVDTYKYFQYSFKVKVNSDGSAANGINNTACLSYDDKRAGVVASLSANVNPGSGVTTQGLTSPVHVGCLPLGSTPVQVQNTGVDLGITKIFTPDTNVPGNVQSTSGKNGIVAAGSNLGATIVVTNISTNTATNVVVTDAIAANWISVTTSTPGCTITGQTVTNGVATGGTLTCNFASVAPGTANAKTITLSGAVSATDISSYAISNTATVKSDQQDSNQGNNSATDTVTVTRSADLQVTKVAKAGKTSQVGCPEANTVLYDPAFDPSQYGKAIAGCPVVWTITTVNSGPSDAKAVKVADVLQPNPDGSYYATFSPAVTPGAFCGVQDAVGLNAAGTTYYQCTTSTTDSRLRWRVPSAGGITSGSTPPSITVTDKNNNPVTNSTINAACPAANQNASSALCQMDTLAVGAKATMVVTGTLATTLPTPAMCQANPNLPCSIVNNANAASATPDANQNNNNGTATINTDSPWADVVVTKTAPTDPTTGATLPVTPGTRITWTATVTNNGPADATNITFTDQVTNQVSGVTVTASKGKCNTVSNTDGSTQITCGASIDKASGNVVGNTLAAPTTTSAGQSITYTITGTVNSDVVAGGTFIVNGASAISGNGLDQCSDDPTCMYDPTPGNNSYNPAKFPDQVVNQDGSVASALVSAVPITPLYDLTITKNVAQSSLPGAGSYGNPNVVYTIKVKNNGPSTATHVDLTDYLPTALLQPYTDSDGTWAGDNYPVITITDQKGITAWSSNWPAGTQNTQSASQGYCQGLNQGVPNSTGLMDDGFTPIGATPIKSSQLLTTDANGVPTSPTVTMTCELGTASDAGQNPGGVVNDGIAKGDENAWTITVAMTSTQDLFKMAQDATPTPPAPAPVAPAPSRFNLLKNLLPKASGNTPELNSDEQLAGADQDDENIDEETTAESTVDQQQTTDSKQATEDKTDQKQNTDDQTTGEEVRASGRGPLFTLVNFFIPTRTLAAEGGETCEAGDETCEYSDETEDNFAGKSKLSLSKAATATCRVDDFSVDEDDEPECSAAIFLGSNYQVVNSVSVTDTTGSQADNSDSATLTGGVTPVDLGITKQGPPQDQAVAGQTGWYTMTVTNYSGNGATETLVTDTLPAGLWYTGPQWNGSSDHAINPANWPTCSASSGAPCVPPQLPVGMSAPAVTGLGGNLVGCTSDPVQAPAYDPNSASNVEQVVTCQFYDANNPNGDPIGAPANSIISFPLPVAGDPRLPLGAQVVNTATVSNSDESQVDQVKGNNVASATSEVINQADIQVTNASLTPALLDSNGNPVLANGTYQPDPSRTSASAGGLFIKNFTIVNNGPSTAMGVQINIVRSFPAYDWADMQFTLASSPTTPIYGDCTAYPQEFQCALYTSKNLDGELSNPLNLQPGDSIAVARYISPSGSVQPGAYPEQINAYSLTSDLGPDGQADTADDVAPAATDPVPNGSACTAMTAGGSNNFAQACAVITAQITTLQVSKVPVNTKPNPWVSQTSAPPAPGVVEGGTCPAGADCWPSFVSGSEFVYQITVGVDVTAANRSDANGVTLTDTLPLGFQPLSVSQPQGGSCSVDSSKTQAWPVTLVPTANNVRLAANDLVAQNTDGTFNPPVLNSDGTLATQPAALTGTGTAPAGYHTASGNANTETVYTVNCNLGTVPGYRGNGIVSPTVITVSGKVDPEANNWYLNADGTTGDNYAQYVPNYVNVNSTTPDANGPKAAVWAAAYVDLFEQANLKIIKTPDSNSVNAGGQLGFTYTIINQGPSSISHGIFTDILLDGLSIDLTRNQVDNTGKVIKQGLNDATFNAAGQTTNIGCQMPVDQGGTIPPLFGKVLLPDGTVVSDPNAGGTVTVPRGDFGPTAPYPAPAPASPPANVVTESGWTSLNPIKSWGWQDVNGSTGTPAVTPDANGNPLPITQFVCRVGLVPAGASIPVHLYIQTPADLPAGSTFTNSATAGDMGYDPDGTDNTNTTTAIAVTTQANLGVTLVSSTKNVAAGATYTYTAVGTNNGPSSALNTNPSMTLPAGFIPTQINAMGNVCTWNTVTTNSDGSTTLTPAASGPGGTAKSFQGFWPPQSSAFNTALQAFEAGQGAQPTPDTWYYGSMVNSATVPADYVNNTTYNASTQWAISCVQDPAMYPDALWAPAQTATATISMFVPADTPQGAALSTATMMSCPQGQTTNAAGQPCTPDNDYSNNNATVAVQVQRYSDMEIVKNQISPAAPASLQIGMPVTYQLNITNKGPSTADNATISDVVPAGFTYVSATILSGQLKGQNCPMPGLSGTGNAVLACNLGTLKVNQTAAINLILTVKNDTTLVGSTGSSDDASASSPSLVQYLDATQQPHKGLCNTGIVASSSIDSMAGTITNGATQANTMVGWGKTTDGQGGTIDNNNQYTTCTTITQPPGSDLAITKTMNATPSAAVGATITSTLTIINNGPQAVPAGQSVTVSDVIPADWTNVVIDAGNSNLPGDVTCTWGNSNPAIAYHLGDDVTALPPVTGKFSCTGTAGFPANVPFKVVLVGKTAANGVSSNNSTLSSLTNTAQISSPWYDPQTSNNISTATLALTKSSDLVAGKSALPAVARDYPGGTIPAGCAGSVAYNDDAPNPSDAAYASAPAAAPNPSDPKFGQLTKQGTPYLVSQVLLDSNENPVLDADGNPVPNLVPGCLVAWSATVTNTGPSDATNVTVNDILNPLADGVTFPATLASADITTALASNAPANTVAASGATCGAVSASGVRCTVKSLPANTSATVRMVGALSTGLTQGTQVTNTVQAPYATDPVPGNNTGTYTFPVAKPAADVRVTKTANTPSVTSGGRVRWTVTMTNFGPSDAQNIQLDDTVWTQVVGCTAGTDPANPVSDCSHNTITVTPSAGSGVCDAPVANFAKNADGSLNELWGTALHCTAGTLYANSQNPGTAGTSVSYTIRGTVDPSFSGNGYLNNFAAGISGAGTNNCNTDSTCTVDPAPLNNVGPLDAGSNQYHTGVGATAINVTPQYDLSVTKTGSTTSLPAAGTDVTYTVTVTNPGPSTAVGVQLNELLPGALLQPFAGDATPNQPTGTITYSPAITVPVTDGAGNILSTSQVTTQNLSDACTVPSSADGYATTDTAPMPCVLGPAVQNLNDGTWDGTWTGGLPAGTTATLTINLKSTQDFTSQSSLTIANTAQVSDGNAQVTTGTYQCNTGTCDTNLSNNSGTWIMSGAPQVDLGLNKISVPEGTQPNYNLNSGVYPYGIKSGTQFTAGSKETYVFRMTALPTCPDGSAPTMFDGSAWTLAKSDAAAKAGAFAAGTATDYQAYCKGQATLTLPDDSAITQGVVHNSPTAGQMQQPATNYSVNAPTPTLTDTLPAGVSLDVDNPPLMTVARNAANATVPAINAVELVSNPNGMPFKLIDVSDGSANPDFTYTEQDPTKGIAGVAAAGYCAITAHAKAATSTTAATGDTVTCTLPHDMIGGCDITVQMNVKIDPALSVDQVSGQLVNTGTIAFGPAAKYTDPSSSNNMAQVADPVTASADLEANFVVTMPDGSSDNPSLTVCQGTPGAFTNTPCYNGDYTGPGSARIKNLTFTNHGPSTAQDVTFSIDRKADLTADMSAVYWQITGPVSAACPDVNNDGIGVCQVQVPLNLTQPWSPYPNSDPATTLPACAVNARELQCPLPALPPEYTASLLFGVTVPGTDTAGGYADTLTVSSSTYDPNDPTHSQGATAPSNPACDTVNGAAGCNNNTDPSTINIGSALTSLQVTKTPENAIPQNPGSTSCFDGNKANTGANCPTVVGTGNHEAWVAGGNFSYQVTVQVPNALPLQLDANGNIVIEQNGGGWSPVLTGAVPAIAAGGANYADAQSVTLSDPLPVGFTATNVSTTSGTCTIGTSGQTPYPNGQTDASGIALQWNSSTVSCNLGTVHGLTGTTRYAYAVPSKDGTYYYAANYPNAAAAAEDNAIALSSTSSINVPDMGQPAVINISGIIDQNANDMYPLGDAFAEQVRNVAVATSTTANGSGGVYQALPIISNPATAMVTTGNANSATLSASGGRNTSTGRATASAMAAIDIVEQADLSVVKTASTSAANAGGKVGFSFTVTNPGPSGVEHVVLTDLLPAGFTVNLNDPANQAQCSPVTDLTGIVPASTLPVGTSYNSPMSAASAIACLGGTPVQDPTTLAMVPNGALSAGQSVTINVVATIADDLLNPSPADKYAGNATNSDGTVTASNTVTAGSQALDPTCASLADTTCGNNTSLPVAVTVSARADLAVAVAVPTTPVLAGSSVNVSANVNNKGESASSNVSGLVTFPAGMTPTSVTVPFYSGSPMVTCSWVGAAPAGFPSPMDQTTGTASGNAMTWTSTATADIQAAPYAANVSYAMKCSQEPGVPWPNGGQGSISAALWVPADTPVDATGTFSANVQSGTQDVTAKGAANGPTPCATGTCLMGNNSSDPTQVSVYDQDATNNSDSGSLTVATQADLAVSKELTTALANFVAGQQATYQIKVTNNGPSVATNVTATDVLPAGLTFVSVDNPACSQDSASAGMVSCTFDTLAAGAANAAVVNVTVLVAADATGALVNPVSISPDQTSDPSLTWAYCTAAAGCTDHSADNSDSDTSTPAVHSDLAVAKTLTTPAAEFVAGNLATYRIVVTNNGPSVATNVTATDALPAGLTFVSVDNTGCSQNPVGTVTCNFASLPAGAAAAQVANVTVRVASTAAGSPIENTATVSSTNATGVNTDGDITTDGGVGGFVPNNNSATTAALAPNGSADLAAVVTAASSGPIQPGTSASFNVALSNAGPSTATNVAATVTFPAGMLPTSVTVPAGLACTWNAPGAPDGSAADLAAGTWTSSVTSGAYRAGTQYSITCTSVGNTDWAADAQFSPLVATVYVPTDVPAGYAGALSAAIKSGDAANSVAGTADPNTDNNTDSAPLTVVPSADLWLKAALVSNTTPAYNDFVASGEAVYQFTVGNDGPWPVSDAVITDVLPAGLTFLSSEGSSCTVSADGRTVTCPVATLNPGDQRVVSLRVVVSKDMVNAQGVGQPITNGASITSPSVQDLNPGNNSDSVTATPLQPKPTDVQIVIDAQTAEAQGASSDSAGAGTATITLNVTVKNNGPDKAVGVQAKVDDLLRSEGFNYRVAVLAETSSYHTAAEFATELPGDTGQIGYWYGSVHFNIGDLNVGEYVTYQISVDIGCPYNKTLVWQGDVVKIVQLDAKLENNKDTTQTDAQQKCNAILGLDKKNSVVNTNTNSGNNPAAGLDGSAAPATLRDRIRVTRSKMTRTGVNTGLLILAAAGLTTGAALTLRKRRDND